MKLGLMKEDFSLQASKNLSSLFNQPDFSDVTLVCEDQKQLLAHKVILASASPFFKKIFLANDHPKPLIFLKMSFRDLQGILRFVYTGECHVDKMELDRFLELAKILEVEGLASAEDTTTNAKTDVDFKKRKTGRDDQESFANTQVYNTAQILKEEPETCSSCDDCGLELSSVTQLTEHIIREHKQTCNYCEKTFPSLKTLQSHKRIHNIKQEGLVDPDLHFPETEEEMFVFGCSERGRTAYDKHFFAFRYLLVLVFYHNISTAHFRSIDQDMLTF